MRDLTIVDLRAEANAEVGRLAMARACVRDDDHRALVQLEGHAAWIAWVRRTARRRRLGRPVWLVWRVAFEDLSGRVVESRLVPVVVDVARLPAKAQRREWIIVRLIEMAPV